MIPRLDALADSPLKVALEMPLKLAGLCRHDLFLATNSKLIIINR